MMNCDTSKKPVPKEKKRKKKKLEEETKRRGQRKSKRLSLVGVTEASSNITQKRITRKLGLFATGKGSSTVLRDVYEERRAREEQDLSKILKLANKEVHSPRQNEGGHLLGVVNPVPEAPHSVGRGDIQDEGDHRSRTQTNSSRNKRSDSGSRSDSTCSPSSTPSPSSSSVQSGFIREEDVLREVSQELNDSIGRTMDSIFPNETEEDCFTRTCRYLQKIHIQSSKGNNGSLVGCDDSSEKELQHFEGFAVGASDAFSVFQFDRAHEPFTFEQRDVVSSSGLMGEYDLVRNCCDTTRIEKRDPPARGSRVMSHPRSHFIRSGSRAPPPGVSSERQTPIEAVANRQKMLLRLQDPNDKDILDYVDNVLFDTPLSGIGLTSASPDSAGNPTWQLPTMAKLPSPSPRFFRHKLY